jgi:hypothetical protein
VGRFVGEDVLEAGRFVAGRFVAGRFVEGRFVGVPKKVTSKWSSPRSCG